MGNSLGLFRGLFSLASNVRFQERLTKLCAGIRKTGIVDTLALEIIEHYPGMNSVTRSCMRFVRLFLPMQMDSRGTIQEPKMHDWRQGKGFTQPEDRAALCFPGKLARRPGVQNKKHPRISLLSLALCVERAAPTKCENVGARVSCTENIDVESEVQKRLANWEEAHLKR